MKRFPLILCAAVLLTLIVWSAYGQRQGSSRVTWEYTVIVDHTLYNKHTDLKQLGDEGWELTAVTTRDQAVGNQMDVETRYYLKRQK